LSLHAQGVNFLEELAVGKKSAKEYERVLTQFKQVMKIEDIGALTETELDEKLSAYFERSFFGGVQATWGAKLLAGLMHRHPQYGRYGRSQIPRAWRSLRGWRRLTPGRSRRPEPLMVWAGIANLLVREGQTLAGLFVLLSVTTYLRPSSLLAVTPTFLLSPVRGVSKHWAILAHPSDAHNPSKTGTTDLSISLDSAWWQPLNPLLEVVKARAPSEPIFPFSYYDYATIFGKAAKQLGIPVVPYQTRHSGASLDRQGNHRSLLEVKQRGDWAADSSVKRYERHARLQHSALRYSGDLLTYLTRCESRLAEIFLRSETVEPPRTAA